MTEDLNKAKNWSASSTVVELGEGFVSGKARVNGTTLHYIHGGHGPTVVLIHGFPQDWYEWREIMPVLAERFTVVAVDLRGVGGSEPTLGGYDAANLAEDIHQLVQALRLEQVYIAGHDIGGYVAYALARRYPEATRGAMVIETPIPGIEPWSDLPVDVPLWHGAFHMVPDLPEALVADRQAVYFRYFFNVGTQNPGVFSDADVAHYAEAYAGPRLRSAFEFYRAIPANMAFNAEDRRVIEVPLMLVGGEHVFGPVMPRLAENLKANYGWAKVEVEIIKDGKHYVVEEQSQEIAALIERHAS